MEVSCGIVFTVRKLSFTTTHKHCGFPHNIFLDYSCITEMTIRGRLRGWYCTLVICNLVCAPPTVYPVSQFQNHGQQPLEFSSFLFRTIKRFLLYVLLFSTMDSSLPFSLSYWLRASYSDHENKWIELKREIWSVSRVTQHPLRPQTTFCGGKRHGDLLLTSFFNEFVWCIWRLFFPHSIKYFAELLSVCQQFSLCFGKDLIVSWSSESQH